MSPSLFIFSAHATARWAARGRAPIFAAMAAMLRVISRGRALMQEWVASEVPFLLVTCAAPFFCSHVSRTDESAHGVVALTRLFSMAPVPWRTRNVARSWRDRSLSISRSILAGRRHRRQESDRGNPRQDRHHRRRRLGALGEPCGLKQSGRGRRG